MSGRRTANVREGEKLYVMILRRYLTSHVVVSGGVKSLRATTLNPSDFSCVLLPLTKIP